MHVYDSVIIGGGPAGLTAALYFARFLRNVALVDDGQSRAALIPVSHNFPGFPDGVNGRGLLRRLNEQLEPYDVKRINGLVTHLGREGDLFLAETVETAVLARTVMLTTGIADKGMETPNWQAGVQTGALRLCPVCDAYEIVDKRVAVMTRTDGAINHAKFLRTYTADLTLIHVMDQRPLGQAEQATLKDLGICLLESRDASIRVSPSGVAEAIVDGQPHQFDSLYPMFGCRSRSDLALELGAECDDEGKLLTDRYQETSIPGLYAAGDIVSGLNQISVAVGQAAVAATHINAELPRQF